MKKLALVLIASLFFVPAAVFADNTATQNELAATITQLIALLVQEVNALEAQLAVAQATATAAVGAASSTPITTNTPPATPPTASTQPVQVPQVVPQVVPQSQPQPVASQPAATATQSQPSTSTQANTVASTSAPWVDIQVNGSDGTIALTQSNTATVSWTSQGAINCQISGAPGLRNVGTSGSQVVSFQAAYNTVDIECSALINNLPIANAITDSVTVTTQGIATLSESLSVARSVNDPASDLIPPRAASWPVGEFTFTTKDSSYVIQTVTIHVPSNATSSIAYIVVNGGSPARSGQAQLVVVPGNSDAVATINNLGMYVPANGSSNLDVYAGTTNGAVPGTPIQISLDTGNKVGDVNSATFWATDMAGSGTTQINGGIPFMSGGVHTVESLADYKKTLGLSS